VYARDALSRGGGDLWLNMPPWAVEGSYCSATAITAMLLLLLLLLLLTARMLSP
jgi:hypothetical protein